MFLDIPDMEQVTNVLKIDIVHLSMEVSLL